MRRDLLSLNTATLPQAAMEYIARGWPVLPLKPRNKQPLTKHGLLEATLDPVVIAQWWLQWPEANIGLRTGEAFDVLDVDGAPGAASLITLVPDGYRHPGPVQSTGKGWHALFAVTGGRNAANKLPGLDFRGYNGYIVAAPSVHPNGHLYRWVRDGDLPEPPNWLYEIVKPKRVGEPGGFDPATMNPIVVIFNSFFGKDHPLEATGDRFKTNCPWHDDSTPSFYLFPENNSFYCFGCDEWGDSKDLADSANHNYASPTSLRQARIPATP